MAEGMLKHRIRELGLHRKVKVSSAGTVASQPGHKPDIRAQRVMAQSGIELSKIKARQVSVKDMIRNDYILAMDTNNYNDLLAMCPEEHQAKINLLLDYSSAGNETDLPDPYYGTIYGFEEVASLLEPAIEGLLQQIVYSVT